MTKAMLSAALLQLFTLAASAQDTPKTTDKLNDKPRMAEVHGTIRGKYEYQVNEKAGRFEVRNARVNVSGEVTPIVSYKAEVDLCDEGVIKMLDAYTRLKLPHNLQFTIGQMRVPFTIDAHRSPNAQYFANRSFIAKQVGNVRDVGAMLRYQTGGASPVTLSAGLFNGSGLTNQKNYWTKGINFSAKAQVPITKELLLTLSVQKIQPDSVTVMMYDGGLTYRLGGLLVEGEYLFKHYAQNAFHNVHAIDAFVCYDIPVNKGQLHKISPLIRWDYMSDHSDGFRYLKGAKNTQGQLVVNDPRRSRLTGGATVSLSKPFRTDIRINYEKYFYARPEKAKVSERDKFVVEFMTTF